MGQFSCWMQVRGMDVRQLTGDVVEDFLCTMRDAGGWWQPTARTLDSLIGCRRLVGGGLFRVKRLQRHLVER
jgi:hypothetical protein